MFKHHVAIVEQFKAELRLDLPDAFSYLSNETEGAATSLEYYGMLRNAIMQAKENGLIPISYIKKIMEVDKAICSIFTS
jgi:hypothetical protein